MRSGTWAFGWLPFLLLVLGCEPTRVGGGAPEAHDPAGPAVDDPGDAPCASLDRARCMRSVVCTLVAVSDGPSDRYVCRTAEGNCEFGLSQRETDRDRCAQRTGCDWREARCYCPCRGAGRTEVEDSPDAESCQCECGGGPPPGCAPR